MTSPQLWLPETVLSAMWSALPSVAERTVAAVIAEVPSYADAFSGSMGRNIEKAVQQALQGFLREATSPRTAESAPSIGPALDGAYALGRGEARNGRSTDVLLAAYRVGARIAWRDLSAIAVSHGLAGEMLALFAELVFAYIDQLSAYSVSGHGDESAATGLARQRNREHLALRLLAQAPAEELAVAAERADWVPPRTLTAVAVPAGHDRGVAALLDQRTLRLPDDYAEPAGTPVVLLLAPDLGGRSRSGLLATPAGRGAVIGPARPWLDVAASAQRVLRTIELGLAAAGSIDTDTCLVELVLRADGDALGDLRAKALAPLADLRPTARDKLIETLRAWLLHHGRRDDIAAELFVHPQTVRYRIGQLRERYGDKLEDPATVLELTLALGGAGPPDDSPESVPSAIPPGPAKERHR